MPLTFGREIHMRKLSRHLPPRVVARQRMPWIGWVVITVLLAFLVLWMALEPSRTILGLMGVGLCFAVIIAFEHRRLASIRRNRDDSICDFGRSFNLRDIDPWLVRATYDAFCDWIDPKQPNFPIRAKDSLDDDLRIDPMDVNDLAHEVAERAGYHHSSWEANPLLGKVSTIEEFVLFLSHQPKKQQAEQGGDGDASQRPC